MFKIISIKKAVFFCVVASIIPLVMRAQTDTKLSKIKAETLYQEARKDFKEFEKNHGKFIQTKNVLMHYLTWGSPGDTPLIWSHGSLTHSYELINIADDLAKAGYYVIAIDYYGHGQTPIPSFEVSLYHIADDIKFLMDELKIKKAVIGGWSRGGYISTAFYDAYPEQVLGLILEDGGSVAMNAWYHKMKPEQLDSTLLKIAASDFPDAVYGTEFDAYYDLYDSDESGNQFHLLSQIKKNNQGKWSIYSGVMKLFNMQSGAQWTNNVLRPTLSPLFAESMSVLEPKIVYRNLNVPVLILDPISENDFMPFTEENKALKQKHPAYITHKIYKDTGHNIHYENPKMFVHDVVDFLNTIKIKMSPDKAGMHN